jgi:uncharacterized protein YgiM (DUF1202 family)
MKMKHWFIVAVILVTGAVVRQLQADQPVATDPANKPATPGKADPKNKAKTMAKKPAAAPEENYIPVTEPGPAVVRQNNVNVRGQAAINSEVIAHLKKGDKVTVLEEITLKKPKTDEPAKWARIALPAGTAVWVHSSFVDMSTKTVKAKKLNLRSGPGENYSVVGHLEKGAAIKEVETKGEWIKIEAPEKTGAFVAAHLLSKDTSGSAVAVAPPPRVPPPVTPPPPVPPPVVTPPPPVTTVAVTPPPPVPPPVDNTPPTPVVPPPLITPPPVPRAVPPPVEEEIIVKRVVTREGLVKGSVSIQAPTYYVLKSLDNGRTINYLHTTSTNVIVSEFWNQKVTVTGEESLDERWPNTPVLTIDSIQAE